MSSPATSPPLTPVQQPAMTPKWRRQRVEMVFWFGPFRLFSPGLEVDVTRQLIPGPLTDLEPLRPLTRQVTEGSQGFFLFAHELAGDLPRRTRLDGMLCYSPMVYDRYIADLSLGTEAYWGKFKSKVRYNLKRTIRLYTEAAGGELDWRSYQTPESVPEFHRIALTIAKQTYQHKLFDGALPDTPEFLAHLMDKARSNDLRAYLLFMKGEPIAYLHMEAEDGLLSYAYVGHRPEWSEHSPGSVLMASAIDALLVEQRFHTLDFGSGDGQHKQVFSTQTRRVTHTFLLTPSWRNQCLVVAHDGFSRLAQSITDLLKRLRLHQRIKQFVRRAVSAR